MTPAQALAVEKKKMVDAAIEFAVGDVSDPEAQAALFRQADALARAAWAAKTSSPSNPSGGRRAPDTSSQVLRFGNSTKGKTIRDADTRGLQWMLGVVRENIEAPDKQRFRRDNESLVAALEAELRFRGEPTE